MKRTAKFIVMLAVVVAVTIFARTAAMASDYGAQADSLSEMGLFLGTGNGYELDRASTRAEAAVMLVRILGKEAEVKEGAYTDPFTDVPDWAENYVGYMYENGLTKGVSDTAFDPGTPCTSQMFTAFVLRALGYSEEGGDFTYAQAKEFAAGIGLAAGSDTSGGFLRGDMVAASYSALFLPVNNGGGTILLEKLVADKAVDASAAEKYLGYYETYLSYLEANSAYQDTKNMRIQVESSVDVTMDGVKTSMLQTSDSAIVFSGNDFIMKQETVTDYAGVKMEATTYYADGWLYIDSPEGKYKYQYPIDVFTAVEQAGLSQVTDPFYMINAIEKTTVSGGVSYKIEYSAAAVNHILGLLMDQFADMYDDAMVQYNALEIVVNFDAFGNLKDIVVSGDVSMTENIEGQEVSMDMTMVSTSKILATGSAVNVVLPADLDAYAELPLI